MDFLKKSQIWVSSFCFHSKHSQINPHFQAKIWLLFIFAISILFTYSIQCSYISLVSATMISTLLIFAAQNDWIHCCFSHNCGGSHISDSFLCWFAVKILWPLCIYAISFNDIKSSYLQFFLCLITKINSFTLSYALNVKRSLA